MSLKTLISVLIVLALAIVALLVFILQVSDDEEASLVKEARPIDSEQREIQREAEQVLGSDDSIERVSVFPDTSRFVLVEECPEILDPSVIEDQNCMDAVEQLFSERATYTLEFVGMVPKIGLYTFRETLDHVERDRELIVEALSRPECQLLEGPIRMELREMCNAEAIFRYSHFVAMCNAARRWGKEFELRSHPAYEVKRSRYQDSLTRFKSGVEDANKATSWIRHLGIDEIEWYYDERNKYREKLLKDMWLTSTGKCPQIQSERIRSATGSDSFRSGLLDWWIEDPAREGAVSRLRHVAARLGFERELLNKTCRFHGMTAGRYGTQGCLGREYEEARRKMHPWWEDLSVGVETFYIYPTEDLLPGFLRASAIIRVSRGLASMEDSGFEADIEWITNFICRKRIEAIEDCQSAIERAENFLDADNTGALRILDRIAEKAIELNLYHDY